MKEQQNGCAPCNGGTASSPGKVSSATFQQHQEENLRRHQSHFVEPSSAFIQRATETFAISRAVIDKLPFIYVCGLDRRLRVNPNRFDPGIYEIEPFVNRITPKTLQHLKRLAGVPNEVFAAEKASHRGGCQAGARLRCVHTHHLPAGDAFYWSQLSSDSRAAVRDLSYNLLMGPVDETVLDKPPFKAVVADMLGRVVRVPTFVGKNLVVCPDETVEFNGFAAVYFDNVIVIGNGRIILGQHTKLHAYQIKHV